MTKERIVELIRESGVDTQLEADAARHVLSYYAKMNAVEVKYVNYDSESDESMSKFRKIIKAKTKVHEKFWRLSPDEHWKPSSHGGEEYRLSDIDRVFVLSDYRAACIVRVTFHKDAQRFGNKDIGYLVESTGEGRKTKFYISNQFSA